VVFRWQGDSLLTDNSIDIIDDRAFAKILSSNCECIQAVVWRGKPTCSEMRQASHDTRNMLVTAAFNPFPRSPPPKKKKTTRHAVTRRAWTNSYCLKVDLGLHVHCILCCVEVYIPHYVWTLDWRHYILVWIFVFMYTNTNYLAASNKTSLH